MYQVSREVPQQTLCTLRWSSVIFQPDTAILCHNNYMPDNSYTRLPLSDLSLQRPHHEMLSVTPATGENTFQSVGHCIDRQHNSIMLSGR